MNTDRDKLLEEYFLNKGKIQPSVSSGIGQALALGVAGIGDAYSSAAGRNSNGLKSSLDNLRNIDNSIEDERRNGVKRIGEYLKSQMVTQAAMDKIKAENDFKLSENQKDRDAAKILADERNQALIKAAGLRAENAKENQGALNKRQRGGLISKFNSDASVKKLQQSINAADQIRGLIESNNPIAAASIPTYAARLAGEVGALSEADKAPFGGSQAIVSKIGQFLTQAGTGKATEENKKFMRELTNVIEKRAKGNIINIAKSRSKQYGAVGYYGNEDEILKTLVPDYQEEVNLQLNPVKDNFTVGKKYKMKDGAIATYIGNGEFE